ncbi:MULTISPECIES: CaiB/BaiF CoA transferase family protein [Streptomyces]|uniref:CoA transferase n=1 Tax=Streptomyces evansiae TaxID=3075535 RepID=A0ABU2QW86_9ACTN|nr:MULTISPECIES: CoA transferase [unclassified Streptomyces]EFL04108.1 formyl-CoA transferase [Streptomyces sp. SPB78]MDT0408226.1 CoA transferase [Streptomyces sp. DSM 41979]MDT0422500.1 CoA transferase [Streptomyces sp. DSM 41859]MYQ58678.1 CoA transferase [Streptomyces sp. SID4926]WEH31306.1 CoA transferase [Streptomyces sp. AM 3-1-1]
MTPPRDDLPYQGLRVLDLSRVLAGPYCTALLADLGADVVKIEPPHGDDARHLGPFKEGESVYFAQLNRGKRSLALDLKDPADHALLLRLAERADVVVENFRPGVAARLGVDQETLRARDPRLVYASISGFGQSGPLREAPAYDLVVQAMSGLMAGTGTREGGPTRVGESLGDLVAGVFASWAIGAALFARERTGRGRYVDVAMLDALVALQVTSLSLLTATGALPGRIGNRHPVSSPFDTYPTADGSIALAVASDGVFARFAALVGRPDLPTDPRFGDDTSRTDHLAALQEITEKWSRARTTETALAEARAAGVPCAPLWDLEEALGSEQLRERGVLGTFTHPVIGPTPYLRQPVRFGTAPPRTDAAPSPDLGADREGVLAEWLA